MISRPAFQRKGEEYLANVLDRLSSSSLTLREAALKLWSEEEWKTVKLGLSEAVRGTARYGVSQAWTRLGLAELELKMIVPGWTEENTKRWSEAAADAVLGAVEDEILSAGGQRMLTKLAWGMMDQAGGFLGTMAAIFVDEEKWYAK